jgi:hypothetical protein
MGVLTLTQVLSGCADPGKGSGRDIAPSAAPSTDAWIGRWNGPEGTFLNLEGSKGNYRVTIQNLDGPRTYQGTSAGGQIHFERNGVSESIHATNGVETGMKWLSDKTLCLTIRTGEGYCRE